MKVGYIKINKQRVLLVGLLLSVGAIALRQPLNRQGVSRYCISSEQGVPVASNNKRQEVQGIIAHKKIIIGIVVVAVGVIFAFMIVKKRNQYQLRKEKEEWFKAAKETDLEVLKDLHRKYKIDLNNIDENEETALHHVVRKIGNGNCIRWLVTQGANINAKNKYGDTALHLSVEHNFDDYLNMLIKIKKELGFNIDIEAKDNEGKTAFMAAVTKKDKEKVDILLSNNAEIDAIDNNGYTPLSWWIAHYEGLYGELDMIKLLISKGADINAKNVQGDTIFMSAADKKHLDIVKYLVENCDCSKNEIEKAYKNATRKWHLKVADYLKPLLNSDQV